MTVFQTVPGLTADATAPGMAPPLRRPWIETFCPAELAGRPVVIVLPGGGYLRHAGHEGAPVALWLNALAINAVVLHYSVAPDRPGARLHPAPLEDVRAALSWLRSGDSGLGIDRSRIGVLGFSAGGHLAATLCSGIAAGKGADRPDLAILAYPVISMLSHHHRGSLEALLGAKPTPHQREQLSADLAVDAATPPTFLWHTADDDSVSVVNSLQYAAALARHGIAFELHVFPQGRHGLGLAHDQGGAADWPGNCARWLASHGWAGVPAVVPIPP